VKKRLSFSRKAVADLDNIWDHTERHWGPDQALRYTEAIRDACLLMLGGSGKAGRYQLGNIAFLKLRVGLHLVFLAEGEDRLVVIRILHVRQDIEHELG
jgi:toxin ParE1/3/4